MSEQVKVTWVPRKYSSRMSVNEMNSFQTFGNVTLCDDGLLIGPWREYVCSADRDLDWIAMPQQHSGSSALVVSTVAGVPKFYSMNMTTGVTTYIVDVPGAIPFFFTNTMVSSSSFINYIATTTNLIRVNPAAATASVVAGVGPIVDLTTHLSRLVGIETNTSKVVWSVAGNYDDWSTTSAGAGSITLNLTNDYLTGIEVIKNQLIITTYRKIIVGYATGMVQLPYRLEEFLGGDNNDVCMSHTSIARFEETLFYAGIENIYRFQDGRQVPIGNKNIIPEIHINGSSSVLTPMGKVISPFHHSDLSILYNYLPSEPHYILTYTYLSGNVTVPVYAYNIHRDTWTTLVIPFTSGGTYNNYRQSFNDGYLNISRGIHFLGNNKRLIVRLSRNVSSQPDDTTCRITSPPLLVGDTSKNYTLSRVMVRYSMQKNGSGAVPTFGISGTVKQEGTVNNFSTVNHTLSTENGVDQIWVDMAGSNITGQYFTVTLILGVSPPTEFIITEVEFFFTEAGEFRGY